MTTEHRSLRRKLLIFPPLAIGAALFLWVVGVKQPPLQIVASETAQAVRVVEAPLLALVPRAEGYGPVRPARVWTAVAQVAGSVVETHPKLRDGEILPEQTLLIRIDPGDYEIARSEARAELAALAVEERNAAASLQIEERNQNLVQEELRRHINLNSQGTTSQSSVNEAERAVLASQGAVQNLRNTLALIPSQRTLLEAKAARAQRDLDRTEIHAPFTLRVANLAIESDQYVAVGQNLLEGDDVVERVEVEAQFAFSNLRRLFLGRGGQSLDVTRLAEQLPEVIGFDPLIRLDLGNHIAEWQAEFVGFSDNVDTHTRTIGVVVAVDKPFEKTELGFKPPLSKGMFVQVVLRGKSLTPRIVIPRSAVRNGMVYVADPNRRLRRQAVEVLFTQGSYSVIASGIAPGEQIVVSDPIPAVGGMLLAPQIDETLNVKLQNAGTEP